MKHLPIIFSVLALLIGIVALSLQLSEPKVGFVRLNYLVYNYAGMKEAQTRFQEKSTVWQSNIDTLKSDFQRSVTAYQADFDKLNEAQRQERESKLQAEENHLLQYTNSVQSKGAVEEEKMTQAVLNQVNSFVKEFGQKHGYQYVLGATNNGSILYGDDAVDLTEDVLKELNDYYLNGSTINQSDVEN